MNTYRCIPLLTPAKPRKKGEGVVVYIPILPADPDTDLDQEPVVPEED